MVLNLGKMNIDREYRSSTKENVVNEEDKGKIIVELLFKNQDFSVGAHFEACKAYWAANKCSSCSVPYASLSHAARLLTCRLFGSGACAKREDNNINNEGAN